MPSPGEWWQKFSDWWKYGANAPYPMADYFQPPTNEPAYSSAYLPGFTPGRPYSTWPAPAQPPAQPPVQSGEVIEGIPRAGRPQIEPGGHQFRPVPGPYAPQFTPDYYKYHTDNQSYMPGTEPWHKPGYLRGETSNYQEWPVFEPPPWPFGGTS